MKIFGERLRALRLEHGLIQQALADLLFSALHTIVGWELRNKEPNYQMVVDIADLFDVSVDYLFGRDAFLEKSRDMLQHDVEPPLKPTL